MALAAVVVVLATACKKDPENESAGAQHPGTKLAPPPPPRHPVHAQMPLAVADAGPAIDASTDYRCSTSRDCVVSCISPGDCCGELCTCSNAYHENELKAVRKRNQDACPKSDDESCPVARCPRPDEDYVPRCREAKCVAAKVPHYWPPATPYRCEKDTDCVVSCSRPNERCPELCSCTNVYHVSELAEIVRINNARYPEDEQATCPVARCAKPLYNVQPVCDAGRCVGKRVSN